ncbi:MAG: hypothetical protein EXR78_09385 [Deltaproteobacteria bacterium]|nr:hypothetical protein [Deltaproteobacteria bacterium]
MDSPTIPPKPDPIASADLLTQAVKVIFSWAILMPIAVIVSGKLLSQRFSLSGKYDDQFNIRIPGILRIRSTNQEVILGFAGFLLSLLVLGCVFGAHVYDFVKSHFGVDPGQFNSLCILSSLLTVLWSSTLYVLTAAAPPDPASAERDRLGSEIAAHPK